MTGTAALVGLAVVHGSVMALIAGKVERLLLEVGLLEVTQE